MPRERPEEVELVHPNRDKGAVKATKAIVILLLLVSIGLMLVVAIGGWAKLEGVKPLLIAYMIVYGLLALFTARWNRGALPLAAALGIILLIFAAISGPEWFARDKAGFTSPALNSSVVGMFTLIIVPVQILLIAFAMRGFSQDWHVEVEAGSDEDTTIPESERGRGGAGPAYA